MPRWDFLKNPVGFPLNLRKVRVRSHQVFVRQCGSMWPKMFVPAWRRRNHMGRLWYRPMAGDFWNVDMAGTAGSKQNLWLHLGWWYWSIDPYQFHRCLWCFTTPIGILVYLQHSFTLQKLSFENLVSAGSCPVVAGEWKSGGWGARDAAQVHQHQATLGRCVKFSPKGWGTADLPTWSGKTSAKWWMQGALQRSVHFYGILSITQMLAWTSLAVWHCVLAV